MKACTQVYTGDGKGKTTAMLGLTLRATGAGLRVYIGQFLKGGDYSEIKAIKNSLPTVTVEQYGPKNLINRAPTEQDKQAALQGLETAMQAASSGNYDIVILDEVNVAVFLSLLTTEDILAFIQKKPDNVELILTGRYAKDEIIAAADLVSEITEVKHYYTAGVPARVGIEM